MMNNRSKISLVGFIAFSLVLSGVLPVWAAVFTVISTGDAGVGSLRWAITQANGSNGNTIQFNIPTAPNQSSGADSWWRITPASALPTLIAAGTIIDGTTQRTNYGANSNTQGPEIEIFGNGITASGLTVTGANVTIKELTINSFAGALPNGNGIAVNGASSTTIYGNYLGTNAIGSASLANSQAGVYVYGSSSGAVIGNSAAGTGNIISGNTVYGVYVTGTATATSIRGNTIGSGFAGTESIGNGSGVWLNTSAAATNNVIGGLYSDEGNLITDCVNFGINIAVTGTGDKVRGNTIHSNDSSGIYNKGVGVLFAKNLISNNTGPGIYLVSGGNSCSVYHNTIHASGPYGIRVNSTGNTVRNNIITGCGLYGLQKDAGGSLTEDHNLITGASTNPPNGLGASNITLDVSDLNLDPLYRNAGAGNFMLQVGSPAINSGIDLGAGQPDMNGTSPGLYFDVAPERGALEWYSPTAVDLTRFLSIGRFGEVRLQWTTAQEARAAGFHLYRSEAEGGPYARINPALIPAMGGASGQTYRWTDAAVTDGRTYWYKLEDVDAKGHSTMHGPVRTRPGLDSDGDGMTDDWEIAFGLNANDTSDASGDLNGDGVSNLEEFLAGAEPGEGSAGQADSVRVLESGPERLVVELVTGTLNFAPGRPQGYELVSVADYTHGWTREEGAPRLPAKAVAVAVPRGMRAVLTAVETDERELAERHLIEPVPSGRGARERWLPDEAAYTADAALPETAAELVSAGKLRGQAMAQVVFHPVRYNPVAGRVEVLTRIRAEVVFTPKKEKGGDHGPVRPSGSGWVKVLTREEGLHRLGWEELSRAGLLSARRADPRRLRLLHLGREVAIRVTGEADGRFNPGDEVIFFAEALATKYTDTNVYWLGYGDTPGRRMAERPAVPPEDSDYVPERAAPAVARFESNEYYWPGLEGPESLERWFYAAYVLGGSRVGYTVSLPELAAPTGRIATVRAAVRGVFGPPAAPGHRAALYVNGQPAAEAAWEGRGEQVLEAQVPEEWLLEGENRLELECRLGTEASYDVLLVDRFEVEYARRLRSEAERLSFAAAGEEPRRYEAEGFVGIPEAFEVTDPQAPVRLVGLERDGAVVRLGDIGGPRRYVLASMAGLRAPAELRPAVVSDLRSEKQQWDMLIVTVGEFKGELAPLARWRQGHGLATRVVTVEEIYDEFNAGVAAPEAIREFLSYAVEHWRAPAPAYLLLVGDASYDPKDYLGLGRSSFVPSYLLMTPYFGETGSDDWYALLDGEGDRLADMAVGRIPARTSAEVRAVVDKIIAYEQAKTRDTLDWGRRVVLAADIGDAAFEANAEAAAKQLPGDMETVRLYRSAIPETAAMRGAILAELQRGALVLNWTGHGAMDQWSTAGVFRTQDVPLAANAGRLPLVLSMTCLDGFFLRPQAGSDCLAEALLKRPGGGAVAAWSPTGMGLAEGQAILDQTVMRGLFAPGSRRLGQILQDAKFALWQEGAGAYDDLLQTYTLFGDPALLPLSQRKQ